MSDVSVCIGRRTIGRGHPVYCVAEIGINHNGDLTLARDMVRAAAYAGCDGVKLQKRTVDLVYTPEQLDRPRVTPFGRSNRELKVGLELPISAWAELKRLAEHFGMDLFGSCWDTNSVDELKQISPTVYKIASPSLTNIPLLEKVADQGVPVIMSVGMSSVPEIDRAVEVFRGKPLILLHCVSAYPTPIDEVSILNVLALQQRYPDVVVGYSGHEVGILPSIGAAALGACVVERHFTLSRRLWGSDHGVSLEPDEMREMIEGIQVVSRARGTGALGLRECEVPAKISLRN